MYNKKHSFLKITLLLTLSFPSFNIFAEAIYQKPAEFVKEMFSGSPPKSSVLWITKSLKPTIYQIMGHDFPSLRVRYWDKDEKTVWVLDEIGKKHPITVGLVVKNNKLERLKVLIFRESRGWEVRHPFFTDQFKMIGTTKANKLERKIDGISGATLSVTALKKLSRLAIYFHKKVRE